jgi:putative alpha-1,2-mannosidase
VLISLGIGMAKAVADCTGENQGGYASDSSDIHGFSHMHDSGTGGVSAFLFFFCCVAVFWGNENHPLNPIVTQLLF